MAVTDVSDGPLHELVLSLSARLASLLEEDVDEGVEEALAVVGRATGVDRVYVMLFDHERETFSNTHEWVADGTSSERDRVQDSPIVWMAPWMEAFASGEAVAIERLPDLPASSSELRRELEDQSIRSVLWVALPGPHRPLGFIGFDAVLEQRSWAQVEVDLLRAAGNVIAGALARKRAAVERDQASARLRALAELVPGAVYQMQEEADGRLWFPYVSAAAKELVGIDLEELRRDGRRVFERVHPDDVGRLMAGVKTSREELQRWREEFRVRDARQGVRWLRGHATPERLTSGATVWHGVLIDVSDEVALAEALRERERVLRRITETLRDIVVLTDAELRVSYVSPSVNHVLGYSVDRVLGEQISGFLPASELVEAERLFASGLRDGDGRTLTHRVLHADGSVRYMETLVHLLDESEGDAGAVFAARDVTERVEQQRRLEQEVRFRTALVELTNDMLGQSLDERFYQQVLERIIDLVPDAQGGSLLLQDDDGSFRFAAAVEFDLEVLGTIRLTPEELGPRSPSVERIHVHETDGRLSSERLQVFARAGRLKEISTTLSVPITAGGVPRGYMNLDNFETEDAFAEESHEIAEALTAQVGIALQRLQLERDLDAERRRYERLASHDPLTGLPNRRLFQDRLEQAITRAHRRRNDVALIYVDLDAFKDVNDTLGHDVGDELLMATAERLVATFRAEDTVARLGGDEFAVVLHDVGDLDAATTVVQKLLEAIETPFVLRGREVSVGASVGIAMYPCDARLSEGLMKAADTAMYRVKQNGKSGFAFYSEGSK